MKYKFGFTLAEILITLGIIGVVAAITIPTLIQRNYEKQTVARLLETQSILTQAVRQAEEEFGDVEGWNALNNAAGTLLIAERLKPFLKIAVDCGNQPDTEEQCMTTKVYKCLNNSDWLAYGTLDWFYKINLLNGTTIWWRGKSSEKEIIVFWIDTNGKHAPNTFGRDTFMFNYANKSLYPTGNPHTVSYDSCNLSGTGWGCAYWVLQHKNMDYLHRKSN